MVTINSGLDNALWSWATSYTDNEGSKKTKTISGVNIIAPNIAEEEGEEPQADISTGYSPFQAKVLSQALASMLRSTYGATTLTSKYDVTTVEP